MHLFQLVLIVLAFVIVSAVILRASARSVRRGKAGGGDPGYPFGADTGGGCDGPGDGGGGCGGGGD